jgi:hypothetical protein
MPIDTVKVMGLMVTPTVLEPAIKGWNRLEGRPRAADFARSLRAEVRDPLWFLTRQWQFGEFAGEDAGSPIDARVVTRHVALTKYRPRTGAVQRYDSAVPLEVTVEREAIPFDLVTHRQVTQAFFRPLAERTDFPALRARYLAAYPLADAAVEGHLGREGQQILALGRAHLLDAAAFLAEIASGAHEARVDTFPFSGATRDVLKGAGTALGDWFRRFYALPEAPSDAAWEPPRLDYEFACAAEAAGEAPTVLVSNDYRQGHLDWYAFDVDDRPEAALADVPGAPPAPAVTEQTLSFIPAPVSFAGMPSPRFWEMEDRRIEFADIDAHTTDVAKLLLTEFALVFSNDWCVVPQEVEVGSVSAVEGLVVTDVFGERTLVRPAGRGRDEDWQRWAMFVLSTRREGDLVVPRLFVPPAVGPLLEGPLAEKVVFLRDEMANMVWAVEHTVPSAAGAGVDGYAVARETAPPPVVPPALPPGVPVRYVLGTDVPRNWRPFVPVRLPGSTRAIRLQRARLPGADRPIRGRVLALPAPSYLFEEEVPRAGTVVTRGLQRARWLGGEIHLWMGRRVTTARGEGSSGLAFDQIAGSPRPPG